MKRRMLIACVIGFGFIASGCTTRHNYPLLSTMPNTLKESVQKNVEQLKFSPEFPDHVSFAIGGGASGITSDPKDSGEQTFFVDLVDKSNRRMIEIDEANDADPANSRIQPLKYRKLSDGTRAALAKFSTGAEFLQWSKDGITYRLISGLSDHSQPPTPYDKDLDEEQLVALANDFR